MRSNDINFYYWKLYFNKVCKLAGLSTGYHATIRPLPSTRPWSFKWVGQANHLRSPPSYHAVLLGDISNNKYTSLWVWGTSGYIHSTTAVHTSKGTSRKVLHDQISLVLLEYKVGRAKGRSKRGGQGELNQNLTRAKWYMLQIRQDPILVWQKFQTTTKALIWSLWNN